MRPIRIGRRRGGREATLDSRAVGALFAALQDGQRGSMAGDCGEGNLAGGHSRLLLLVRLCVDRSGVLQGMPPADASHRHFLQAVGGVSQRC